MLQDKKSIIKKNTKKWSNIRIKIILKKLYHKKKQLLFRDNIILVKGLFFYIIWFFYGINTTDIIQ